MRRVNERFRNGSDIKFLFKYFLSGKKKEEMLGALRESGMRIL